MLRERREKQQQMDLVILEQLVPENHLLRRIDAAVDFSFSTICAHRCTAKTTDGLR